MQDTFRLFLGEKQGLTSHSGIVEGQDSVWCIMRALGFAEPTAPVTLLLYEAHDEQLPPASEPPAQCFRCVIHPASDWE